MSTPSPATAVLTDPLGWIQRELEALEADGLRRHLRTYTSAQGVELQLDGRRLVNFATNDYLGLAGDARLVQAARTALDDAGIGAAASPLVAGRSEWHARLEARLAEFEGAEAALLFVSGYAANSGTIPALVGPGDVVFSDQWNHASIIDGCRLSRARVLVYPHGDAAALARLLAECGSRGRRLIVSDGLFSMDGDLAPLVELARLAERYEAMLMVDEAHATGVFGPLGRGAAEALGVGHRVDIRLGTLSKALGAAGGFVAGSRPLVDWLANRGRSYVFSTAAPPAVCAAALAALDVVAEQPERRSALLARAEKLRRRLTSAGWNLGRSQSQIVPLLVGQADAAVRLSDELARRGFLVPAIRPPSVPAGQARLRISLSSAHRPAMLDGLAEALAELAPRFAAAGCL